MRDHALCDDPDLHLLIDGRRVDARAGDGGPWCFDIPAGVGEVLLVSRCTVPALLDASHPDGRRLGVSLRGLSLRSEALDIHLRHDDPALVHGFHAAEPTHRWTDGRAVLPAALLAAFPAGCLLELDVRTMALRYPLP